MKKVAVVFLCSDTELTRERRGYFRAFSKRVTPICVPLLQTLDHKQLKELVPQDIDTLVILQPDANPYLPLGLVDTCMPTACFSIDTYSGTTKRIKWSMLFDYAFVFHPGYDSLFSQAGHPRAICLPHAVEADLFEEPELYTIYDIGWVGRLEGRYYSYRRSCIRELQNLYRMNDPDHYYSTEQMAQVYKQSKIVVNLSRDDYLQDANLRCFEAMAAGALLLTPYPTELTQLGFVENKHYVTFTDRSQLLEKVAYYLAHPNERLNITRLARALVLEKHTYDCRVQSILSLLEQDAGQLFAPARGWDKAQVHSIFLYYYAKHLMLEHAIHELNTLRRYSLRETIKGILVISKAVIRSLQLSVIR